MPEDGRIRTSFLDEQAKTNSQSPLKSPPIMIVLGLVICGILWCVYQGVMFFLNFDKTQALKNVTVNLKDPGMLNGVALVSVTIGNLNPVPVQNVVVRYNILGPDSSVVASDLVTIPDMVPAGDERTFPHVKIGKLVDQSARMQAELADLKLGPKTTLSADLETRFSELAAVLPTDQPGNVKDWEQFVKDAPDFVPGYICLGRALMKNDNYAEAITPLKKAVELAPKDADAHYQLGVALEHTKQKTDAEKELQAAYDLLPNDPDIQRTITDMRQ